VTVGSLVRAASAVGAVVDVRLPWNGEQLDRLLDEAHASLVDRVVVLLRRHGWDVAVEVSFAIWGERGSIDVLAYHAATRTLLVVEVKTVVPDSQATIHGLDRKARLAPQIALERGWESGSVARLLVVGSSATSRHRVTRLDATYSAAFPARPAAVRAWLRRPVGAMSGLLFVAYAPGRSGTSAAAARQRVRRSVAARPRVEKRATDPDGSV